MLGFGGKGDNQSISKEEQNELDQMEKALKTGNENVFGATNVNIDDSVDKEVQELFMNPCASQKDSDSLRRDVSGG